MLETLKSYLPILKQLENYSRDDFTSDVAAGFTVSVMLIPQGMAYALIAGLDPIYGLYASLVPPFVYALFGTSRQLAVGPTALVSLLVAASVRPLADGDPAQYLALALVLTVLVGAIQVVLGLARFGVLTNFLSEPVLAGFSAAAALIIGLSQLDNLLGMSLSTTGQVHAILWSVWQNLGAIHGPTVAVGGGGIALLILLQQWSDAIPAALVVVAAGATTVWALDLEAHGVEIVGAVPEGLPAASLTMYNLPALFGEAGILTWTEFQSLLASAVAIALIGFVVSVTVGRVYASKYGYEIDGNQELIGLGMANLVGAIFQAYPVTGSFSRTAVNARAGARSTIAAAVCGGIVGLTLLFLTPLIYYLPTAVLASIVMVAVVRLVEIEKIRFLWAVSRTDFGLLVVTALITLTVGITEGILSGILISLLLFVRRSFRPNVTTIGRLPDTNTFADIERHPEARTRSDLIVFRIDASLHFANAKYLTNLMLDVLAADEALRVLILDAYPVNRMDGTAAYVLRDVIEEFQEMGDDFYVAGAKGELMDRLRRAGVVRLLGEDHFFRNVSEAVEAVTDGEEAPARKSPYDVQAERAGEREEPGAPAAETER